MFAWLGSHIAVILICIGLLAMVAGAVAVLVHDKKRGKSSCSGNCACCAFGCRCGGAGAAEKGAKP